MDNKENRKEIPTEVKQNGKKYMNLSEIKAYLGVSHQTIYRWVEDRSFPVVKIGTTTRYDRDQVDQWIADQQ